ncbi:MAG: hypothetical protein ACTSX0_11680 [Promethearchaeota archaeon]
MKKPLEKYGKLRYRENIVAFALSFFIWLFWWYFIPKMGVYGSDGSKYIQMAMGNYSDVPSPFRYRVLIPIIASHFKNPAHIFRIITFWSEVFSGYFLFLYLRALKIGFKNSLLGIVLFFFSFNGPYYSYYPYLTDPLNLFFISISFYAIVKEKKLLYLITLVLGILNRETIIFTLIPYFIHYWYKNGLKNAVKNTLLLSILPIVTFIIIRYPGILPSCSGEISKGYSQTILNYFKNVLFSKEWLNRIGGYSPVITSIFDSYGIIWLLFVFGWKNSPKISKYFLLFLLPFLGMIFADPERMLIPAFPVIISIAIYGIDEVKLLLENRRKYVYPIFISAIIIIQFFWSFEGYTTTEMLVALRKIGLVNIFYFLAGKKAIGLFTLSFIILIFYSALTKFSRRMEYSILFFALLIIVVARTVPIGYNPEYTEQTDQGCVYLNFIENKSKIENKNPFEVLGYNWAFQTDGEWKIAEKKFDEGDTTTARKLFNEALLQFPKLNERYIFYTVLYSCSQKYEKAKKWARYGMFFTPEIADIPFNLGLVFFRTGNSDSSLIYFKKAYQIDPTFTDALLNIGATYLDAGNCDSALYYTKTAIQLNAYSESIRMNYILALHNCEKYDELDKEIDKLLEDIPDIPEKETLLKMKRQIQLKIHGM